MSKDQILIVDFACPDPYDANTLKTKPMGGTEATVVRVAEGLSEWYDVTVIQHNRAKTTKNGAAYAPMTAINDIKHPKQVICLRDPRPLAFLKNQYPDAGLFLWLHDLDTIPSNLAKVEPLLHDVGANVICVSNFHKTHIIDSLRPAVQDRLRSYIVDYIYNPIDDDLKPKEQSKVDDTKLLFMSSPHKGLELVLKAFDRVKRAFPQYRLHIANPGYLKDTISDDHKVKVLGSLNHDDVIRELRSSFCLFYPNHDYFTRETFGIVYAEANAVGTPVIAHPIGAAREVLSKPTSQLLDCRNMDLILNTLEAWQHKRPKPKANPKFRLKEVLSEWRRRFK